MKGIESGAHSDATTGLSALIVECTDEKRRIEIWEQLFLDPPRFTSVFIFSIQTCEDPSQDV